MPGIVGGWKGVAFGVALIGLAGATLRPRGGEAGAGEDWGTVRRVAAEPAALVAGEVFSRSRTVVEVEVEDLRGRDGFEATGGGPDGATTITWMVPDGADVERGEVICRLDSSWFDERLRQQAIAVERATAERTAADLRLEVARAELRSFCEGERVRQASEHRTAVALARATTARAADRLAWVDRMLDLGYLSVADRSATEAETARARFDEQRAEVVEQVYDRYTAPRIARYCESQVEQAAADAEFARVQLEVERGRLDLLREQVDRCTIRAPRAGKIIYADLFIREWYQLRPGAEVYTGQPIFYLPDLTDMGVTIVVPESFTARVRVGQTARVRIGAYPGEVLVGKVASLESLPVPDWTKWDDLPVFYGTVELDAAGRRLMPGMSAAVEILTGPADDRLAVPAEAVLAAEGREYCDCLTPAGVVRRPVRTASGTPDWLEVVAGLAEGDRVRLRPWRFPDPGPGPGGPGGVADRDQGASGRSRLAASARSDR